MCALKHVSVGGQGKKPAKSAAVAMEEDSDGSDYNPESASESDADSQVAACLESSFLDCAKFKI